MGKSKRSAVNIPQCSLLLILAFVVNTCVVGMMIEDYRVYNSANSPYIITDDILIKEGGHLFIQPGTTLKFDPGVGITVKGVITAQALPQRCPPKSGSLDVAGGLACAKEPVGYAVGDFGPWQGHPRWRGHWGTPDEEIVLTSTNPPEDDVATPDLRLVDGPAPTRGRLQMFYKDKWRSICTNFKNWTEVDRQVACRQLGFTGGYFYEWQDRPNNDTATLLFESPSCLGLEDRLTQCAWNTHAMGGGVCDLHPDMGLACDEYHAPWRGNYYWRGLLFIDAEYSSEKVMDRILFEKVSRSSLKHVRIEYAGMGSYREVFGAIASHKVPPRVSHVTVTRNAYTGINFTLPDTYVSIDHSVITHNAGIGIYVNTSLGTVSIGDDTLVADNFGDGVKYNLHYKEPDLINSEQFLDFCSGALSPGQTYPMIAVARQKRFTYQEEKCKRRFFTNDPSMLFTVHFIFSQVDQDDSSTIEVRDRDQFGVLLTKFSIRNDTRAPSVVSRTNGIYITFRADAGKQVVTYMQVYAHKYKIPDISFNHSISERNVGHGVSVDNMRSLVLIHKSNLTDNIFGSGLNVRGGAGDVNVTYSTVTNNIGDGVNVTYEGGTQNVTWSTVSSNVGRGVAVWFNESGLDTRTHQETGVAYSTFVSNVDVGLLVGNFCREALVNVSTNYFNNCYKAALQVDSCWRTDGQVRTTLIGHNTFRNNKRLAISVIPAVNMNLTIQWNEFHHNERGTIKVYNEDLIELERLPVQGVINENTFTYNSGIYVMLITLNLLALDQHLLVTRNTVKNNLINELYPSIASRSRAAGVVCIGSFNVELYRNLIENPESIYELSSHTPDQSAPINASYNWLGTKMENEIFDRVFDRRDRYTLALIVFHPFLLSDNNVDTPVVSHPQQETEPYFFDPEDESQIGGEVNGNIVLTKDFYNVVRDIYVQHTGMLTIPFGTTLEFAEGVGVMVTGTLRTEGSGDKRVRFTLAGTTDKEIIKTLLEEGRIDDLPDNMTSSNKTVLNGIDDLGENDTYMGPRIPLKLVGGKDETEGRLMVYSDGIWGTVCDHGFKEDTAAIACQQMGLVLNPDDWFLEAGEIPHAGSSSRILRSNVRCDEFDTDFLECESDFADELENSCNHDNDVGIRCYPRTWAGIRFGMTARESHVKGVVVEKAGLLDYSRRVFKPALQVDFNQHVLQELLVQDNSQDGIGIIRNNQYAISNTESRVLRNCILRNNRRHGISFTQLGANITDSKISDNEGSGVHFNPFISREQQREVTGWLNLRWREFQRIPQIGNGAVIALTRNLHKAFLTQNLRDKPQQEITFTVTTDQSNVIGIQILNPIIPMSTEQVIIYDYPRVYDSKDISRWNLRNDLSVFPTTSSSYAITIQYSSGPYALGDTIFLLTAVEKRDIAKDGDFYNFQPKVPMVFIEDSVIFRNEIGISTLHYDRYLTDDKDHMLRNGNETIAVVRSHIVQNRRQAVHTFSPFREAMDNDRIGEITFMFNDSVISRNGRGIEQFSWNMRESNNLFHWTFDNVTMERNGGGGASGGVTLGGGGVSLSLPFVWQYNENFTHTVYVNKSRFVNNKNFDFTVDGHFARVNISKSLFEKNECDRGVLAMKGMEKEMFIRENIFRDNVGLYMVEFNADSQSEILGNVYAYFTHNIIQDNRHPHQVRPTQTRGGSWRDSSSPYLPASTAVSVRGLQPLNITYNLFGDNEMDYELLAGLFTARIENLLNVRANWWGSREVSFIRERIFDFDDWNNYAVAFFRPFLIENSFNSPVAHGKGDTNDGAYVKDDTLGGRLEKDLLLQKRTKPYIVRSDLTVMPGVILRIEPGVVMEFFPSVGILVLGKLEAIGRRDERIIMRPVDLLKQTQYRVGRHTMQQEKIDVRLCIEGDCERRRDGFLDIYNSTTREWVPMCDHRFSERNAQVVCNQLGFNRINVFYARDKRTEMYPNALHRIRSWPEPIQCQGLEASLGQCPIRMNGQIFDHHYECEWNGDFVYIHCGDLNLPGENYEYWGGIRFSIPDFEFSNLYDRIHDTNTPHTHHHTHDIVPNPSILAWADVIGAGILHNEKSPAILSFYETPKLLDVSITHSAHDGVTLISSHESFEMLHNRFERNLGVGVSLVGLTGETRENSESSFIPVAKLRIPYHVFGMVDICDSSKVLVVEERVLVYYKYDNRPVDCVKIFASAFDVKKFGFRLLQFNLFNSTTDPMMPDRLVIFDGDVYNVTTRVQMATLNASTPDPSLFLKTKTARLSVQLHATGASGNYGFVAEIVTLPISTIGLDRDLLHNMTYNQFYRNQEGAIFAVTAGEVNPWLAITWNRIEDNGLHMYGNITNTDGAITMDLQNMRTLYFKNNLVRNNTGGLNIEAGSNGAATKLSANITNNLFEGTDHRPSLYIEAKKRSAYQQAIISYNDFSWARIPYRDVITLAQIVSDFSYNYVHSNLGRHILDIYGFEKVRLPVYQTTSHNSFAKNIAVDPTYPGTVVAGSAGQQYVDNVFFNLDNAYEMVAVNESMSGLRRRCNTSAECQIIPSFQDFQRYLDHYRMDVWKTPVDARSNWWGFNTSVAVSGRIHDKLDDQTLLKVDYSQWKLNNFTLLRGCEPGYTLVAEACYLYVGSPITYAEAKEFCKRDNGSLPFLQSGFHELRLWLKKQQPEYQWDYDMVWVSHYDFVAGGCAAFVDFKVRSVNCDLNLPFICESDSEHVIDPRAWVSDSLVIAAVAATIGCLLLVVACLSCWMCKSKQRRKERIIRRNSIRASIRSNRSVLSTSSGGFSDIGHRRRIIEEPNVVQPTKGSSRGGMGVDDDGGATANGTLRSTVLSDSFNSIAKSNLNFSEDDDPSYVVYETTQSPPTADSFHGDIDNRFAYDPALENLNANLMVKPTFDLAYQNRGFRDTSTFASTETSGGGFESVEPSTHFDWNGSNSNLPGSSYSSFLPSGGRQPPNKKSNLNVGRTRVSYPNDHLSAKPIPKPYRRNPAQFLSYGDICNESPEYEPFLNTITFLPKPVETRTPSSFRDRSLRGSTSNLGVDQPVVDPLGVENIHLTDTLPRDTAPEKKFAAIGGTSRPSKPLDTFAQPLGEEGSRRPRPHREVVKPPRLRQENLLEGLPAVDSTEGATAPPPGELNKELSASQPLETAM